MTDQVDMKWLRELESLVVEHLVYFERGKRLDPATELSALGLDSLASVRLLVDLEAHFDIEVPPEDLTPAAFRTLGDLRNVVGRALDAMNPER